MTTDAASDASDATPTPINPDPRPPRRQRATFPRLTNQVTHREPEITHAEAPQLQTRVEKPSPRPANPVSKDGNCPSCGSVRSRLRFSEPDKSTPGRLREYRSCKACLAHFVTLILKT